MKAITPILLLIALYAGAQDLPYSTPDSAAACAGTFATVCGKVSGTFLNTKGTGTPTYVNMGRPYPNQPFTAVIWGNDLYKFPYPPAQYLAGKQICVTGMVTLHKGKPQIVVDVPGQIEVTDTLNH